MDESWQKKVKKSRALTKDEKVGLFLLFAIGGLGAIFGFKSFSATLNRPFELQLASYQGENFLTLSEQEALALETQKTSDTDGDGLSDYDELYIYKTSPFLADSDSDTFDDQTEIFSSHNPNCPEGRDCSGNSSLALETVSGANSEEQQAVNMLSQAFNLDSSKFAGLNSETGDIASFLAGLQPSDIRTMLINQGVAKATVDQMSDDQILELLTISLEELQKNGELDSLSSTNSDGTTTPSSENIQE